ncbi:divergent polysaccharide deacetylase family protein [Pseudoalteromonas fenneropenaei]|uniref:Divergent polysaccharide deacetylase family protein n=1 Tax=Pseudoalteromonas fenneropenaei TaxID=1737459 RepID=A0ABV7CHE2_9GAMM
MWGTLAILCCNASATGKTIAIVIDDIGYHQRDLELLSLPGAVTFSILPHTPYSQQFAYLASKEGKELLLHVPMQANEPRPLGPGGLTLDMNKNELQSTLGHALASLPQVRGINNHMGSALTQQTEAMKWVMELLKKRDLFFLDSRTTELTQAQSVANLYGVANVARNVFLDNELSEQALQAQLDELKRVATNERSAIAIAHPYPETFIFLAKALPQLLAEGYNLVPVSQLVSAKYLQLATNEVPDFIEPILTP